MVLKDPDIRPVYTLADLAKVREETMLGSRVTVRDEEKGYILAVVLAKYPNLVMTSAGCFTWNEILQYKRKKVNRQS